jgi:hypothetical protein
MNTNPSLDRTFPLSGGSEPRPSLRPPRLPALVTANPGVVWGNCAFLRAWAARRLQAASALPARPNISTPG